MKRLKLFAKGVCMGLSDIIPGVSGGTMALILGIYTQFIDSLKGLHLRWVGPLWRWISGGRKARDWRAFVEQVNSLNLPFLITLGSGIVVALGIGSAVIPSLMAAFPEQMRAFFFGLILASVWVPLAMISAPKSSQMAAVVLACCMGAGLGYFITNPANEFEATRHWTEVTSRAESLEHLARRPPSALSSDEIYWSPKNRGLRADVARRDPAMAAHLQGLHARAKSVEASDKSARKDRAAPYNELKVADGVAVQVPQPAYWYVFAAGAVAISAMLLPGISGSYILLILGAYFFILNALKGFLKTLISGAIPTAQAPYVVVFVVGVAVGLLSFARLLSYLLHRHRAPTLATLVGLMVGCLRGIWPFRATVDGIVQNVVPAAISATVIEAGATFVAGLLIVGVLTRVGQTREADQSATT